MNRTVSTELVNELVSHPLYQNHIAKDMKKGEIFPSIRNEQVIFYYKGGRLFSFEKNTQKGNGGDYIFKTHIKYASILKGNYNSPYVSQEDLKSIRHIRDFSKNYTQIKKNCSLYAGVEAKGVSEISKRFSFANSNNSSDYIVLDIECPFQKIDLEEEPDKNWRRIDILFLNKRTGKLTYCEAKDFSNPEIWNPRNNPSVISQVKAYEDIIRLNEKKILKDYSQYVKSIQNVFNINMLNGMTLSLSNNLKGESLVFLLIFGFNREEQKSSKFKSLITLLGKSISIQTIGGPANIKESTLKSYKL